MGNRIGRRVGLMLCIVLGVFLSCCIGVSSSLNSAESGAASGAESAPVMAELEPESAPDAPESDGWERAIAAATRAAELSSKALSAADWDQVSQGWGEAVAALQTIPPDSPKRVFVQRKLQEYLANLAAAQQRAERSSVKQVMPSLGSPVLDEQIALYRSYVATMGVPEVLIVGSSRALQGLDPQALEQGLATSGHSLNVYNFSVNGATAQMVSFVLRQLLSPEELPELVIWPVGSRAFNSARFDRTFASLLASPGYAAVRSDNAGSLAQEKALQPQLPISDINAYGFLSVAEQFNPASYYRRFPRVSGRYDDDYSPFTLSGVQTMSFEAVADFLRSQQIPLLVVNLPLSSDYLDATRLAYERQFQRFLQQQAQRGDFRVVDLLEQWRGQNQYFADPSHINRFGAAAIARQLAASQSLPWPEANQ